MPTLLGEVRDGTGRVATQNGQPVYEETYNYIVRADYIGQPRIDILNTPGLPSPGVTASAGGFALCQSVTAVRRTEGGELWDVTAEFSSDVEQGNEGEDGQDPTSWIPVYETQFERVQKLTSVDEQGKKFVNSAGDDFDTKLTVQRYLPVWKFYQFEPATVSDEIVETRCEVVNENVFRGKAAKTLLCKVESSVIGYYYGKRLRFTSYSLTYDRDTWVKKVLDVGPNYLTPLPVQVPVAFEAKGEESDSGVPYMGSLDGSGGKVDAGDPPAELEFDIYPTIDFSSFLRE